MTALKCGLLGRVLGHSFSPQIHAQLSNYEYLLYEKEPEELEAFIRNGDFTGLNVTMPYKKSVIPFCDELSETAKGIGSVNTLVRRMDGTLFGDNTDAFGFESLIRKSGISVSGKKAIVLGSGGASVTACFVLKKLGASSVTVISRSGPDNYENIEKHFDTEIIVNTTPVGMFPDNGGKLLKLKNFPKLSGVLDVVYNPIRTALILEAEALGIPCAGGLHMLVAQAVRSCEQFADISIPDERIAEVEAHLQGQMQNIVVIGMPGSGKTTVSEELGKLTGRTVIDTDAEIVRKIGCSIPEYFKSHGEEAFRQAETEVIRETGKRSGIIISTGGGCVTRKENYPLLHQNGVILWIKRPLNLLPKDGRPISMNSDMAELERKRFPMYEAFADIAVDNSGSIGETVSEIMKQLM